MTKFISTNITLDFGGNIELSVSNLTPANIEQIKIKRENVEELRDMLNDFLQMEKEGKVALPK